MLGEFEYLLLSAAARLGEDAYGAAIRHEIETATGRRCSIGAPCHARSSANQGLDYYLDG